MGWLSLAHGGAWHGYHDQHLACWPCRVMDDLQELQAFLTQRSAELGSGAGEALAASLPQAVQARLAPLQSRATTRAPTPWLHTAPGTAVQKWRMCHMAIRHRLHVPKTVWSILCM